MNILFLTLLNLEDLTKTGIYHDLVNELHARGHNVTVASASEKRQGGKTELLHSNGIDVLRIQIGDITQTSYLKKGINTLRIEKIYMKAIKKYPSDRKFDLIIYTTPPITFNKLVSKLKKRNNAKTFLLLKDIFPQNAVDLALFKENGPIYRLFRSKEKKLYRITDYMGAMSKANINFVKSHNDIYFKSEVIRNALYEMDYEINQKERNDLIEKLGLNPLKRVFLYGGNLSIPQGIEFIKQVMTRFNEVENAQMLIVGNGTHFKSIHDHSEALNYDNVKVFNALPKEHYDKLVAASDIGLVFLDNRFIIPNYPSRLTSLLNARKPILMATDINTDIKDDVLKYQCGLWFESDDVDQFIENAKKLATEDLSIYQDNAYHMFDKEFRIEDNVTKLLNMIK